MSFLKKQIIKQANRFGYNITKLGKNWPTDFDAFHKSVITKVQPYTMTGTDRLFGLIEAVKYVVQNQIDGAFVECGVWKGGSMLAAIETLVNLKDLSRQLYLYDTFEGMSAPTKEDVSCNNQEADRMLQSDLNKQTNLVWAYSTLEEVKKTIALGSYPSEKIHYIKGKVEDTLPSSIPDKISLLRLDTDWYESTKHELVHLYPRLVKGGVLIIDDYGYWKGAKKAVDEYFQYNKVPILLNRMDETGRIAVKQ
jgi:hypothetical protein